MSLANELQERRNELTKQMRDLHELCTSEDRSFTPEEQEKWDKLDADQSALEKRVDIALRAEKLDHVPIEDRTRPTGDDVVVEDKSVNTGDCLRTWLNPSSSSPDQIRQAHDAGFNPQANSITFRIDRGTNEFGDQFPAPKSAKEARDQALARRESRAQSVGTATAGGDTVPDEMMREIDVALLRFGGMRQVSTIITTETGGDLPIPTTNDTAQKGEILAENTAVNDQDATFGQLVLEAYKYSSKMIKVSVELMQDNSVNLPALLGRLLGERLGRIENDHFTTGTGTGQPNGVVTAAANSGVTAATAGELTYGEIVDLMHSVDPAYREMGGRLMGHDTTLAIMKKIADSEGRPIWLPGLVAGEPDTFLGAPFTVNQSMPTGAAAKGLLYGDFSKYLIRDVQEVTLLRLNERFADLHQVAFLAFMRCDGDLLDAGTNPVSYLTLA